MRPQFSIAPAEKSGIAAWSILGNANLTPVKSSIAFTVSTPIFCLERDDDHYQPFIFRQNRPNIARIIISSSLRCRNWDAYMLSIFFWKGRNFFSDELWHDFCFSTSRILSCVLSPSYYVQTTVTHLIPRFCSQPCQLREQWLAGKSHINLPVWGNRPPSAA